MEKPQFAYTGASPAKGYVGYVNIQEKPDGSVRFTVRSEGEDAVSATHHIPKDEALKMLSAAVASIGAGE